MRDAATAPRFKHLVDNDGKWIVRDDVWISYLDRKGPLTVGYGAKNDRIGPELGFGNVVGLHSRCPAPSDPLSDQVGHPLGAGHDLEVIGRGLDEHVRCSRAARLGDQTPDTLSESAVPSYAVMQVGIHQRRDAPSTASRVTL